MSIARKTLRRTTAATLPIFSELKVRQYGGCEGEAAANE
jgi:hypothetical protein